MDLIGDCFGDGVCILGVGEYDGAISAESEMSGIYVTRTCFLAQTIFIIWYIRLARRVNFLPHAGHIL